MKYKNSKNILKIKLTCLDPVIPNGCPIEIAPPLTFIFSWSIPNTSEQRNGTTANASFNSLSKQVRRLFLLYTIYQVKDYQRSISDTLRPWRDSNFGTATIGPIPISSGSQPPTAKPIKAPSGVSPIK